ncbi:MAG: hypothetical protein RI973_621 [Bacteroidota bacterium]
MKLKLIIAATALLSLTGCREEVSAPRNAETIQERQWKSAPDGKPVDELAANAIADSDTKGKIMWSLSSLQTAYREAEGKVPGLGKVTVMVDDDLYLIISNELEGGVEEKRASLKSLDPDFSHVELIVNKNPDEFPGLKIPVLNGKEKVLIIKNGVLQSKVEYLEIILADRPAVQKMASGLTNAIQAAQGQL